MVSIEIDGKQLTVESGSMIIEAADAAGIRIPRFCYHKKLSVAANCRMCLVEVEKSRKPLPACATPVTDGMKVFTTSEMAIQAQKVVMEFLLINHPLDCPICDQGGECELQDVSMGYGQDISRFTEGKRVVEDEDIGSLISTDMTRCIHCTRCVRFGEEVAGVRELGATGRGENTQIGTFIKHSMTSPVSGNVIDLCPVGALTAKPSRYTARAWELTEHAGIAAHDCLGSHINLHSRRQKLMRVVPRECEAINETWISDRDRYSYIGLNSSKRAEHPMIKRDGRWETVDWTTALKQVATSLQQLIELKGPEVIGALASPSSTTEELYLLQKLLRSFGCSNVDYRLLQSDFADQQADSLFPAGDTQYADLSEQDAVLVVGSNLINEQPLAAVRVRRAVSQGAQAVVLNPIDYDFAFDVAEKIICTNHQMVSRLAEIAKVLSDNNNNVSEEMRALLAGVSDISSEAEKIANTLRDADKAVIVSGAIAQHHPAASTIRALLAVIAECSGAQRIVMTHGANAAGAHIAGAIPHRKEGGQAVDDIGLNAQSMLDNPLSAYVLLNVEVEYDCANPQKALNAMKQADCVIALTPVVDEGLLDYADVILPMAAFAETSGTFININGDWQSFTGAIPPVGEARPAWKILRVLGNLFNLPDFNYVSSTDVLHELAKAVTQHPFKEPAPFCPHSIANKRHGLLRVGEQSMYSTDSIVRRADALVESASNDTPVARINTKLAQRMFLTNARKVQAVQDGQMIVCDLQIDDRVADNQVHLVNGLPETARLGDAYGIIELKVAEKVD